MRRKLKEEMMTIKLAKPNFFQVQISNCGTDACNGSYKQIENKNPVILGRTVVSMLGDNFAPPNYKPLFEYYIACAILKGLEYDKEKLFRDIDNIQDTIKGLSLEEKKEVKDGRPNNT
jgi:hypothetical protein